MFRGFFAEIADRAPQVAVFRNFDEPRADVLAVLAAPAAVAAAFALEFRDGLERLALHVVSLVEETGGVLGDLKGKIAVLGAGFLHKNVLPLPDLSGRDRLEADWADAFSF